MTQARHDQLSSARTAVSLFTLMLALYYLLVAFDNITNPASNWAFVKGVMTLDGVAPDSGFAWRAINIVPLQVASYVGIILCELAAGVLLALGGCKGILANRRDDAAAWCETQRISIYGTVVALAVFLLGFIVIGGNWFVMYLNTKWNGLEPAFQNSAMVGLLLVAILTVTRSCEDRA